MAKRREEVCLGCSVNVQTEGKRRVLHNPSTYHILSVLHVIMLSSYLEEDVKRVVPDSSTSQNFYIHMKCFRGISKAEN